MEQLIDLMPLDCYHENGAFYPLIVVEEAVNDFNTRNPKGMVGESSMPILIGLPEEMHMDRYTRVELSRASHIVRHFWIDDGILRCKVFLLGKYAQLAEEMDFEYYGVPRATGVSDEQGVCSKYTLITVDLSLPDLSLPEPT